ncbi:Ankyrin repeat-containing protein [Mesobacillus persicus]|uniref:Ankyrin repeat-containing protein n=1 Tax=Mesobacillus persicus TaxID=930146 RepID=A0A1H8L114_9BACI|nr:ankyrin repeat domain-containing protein [Mesobacillus persicus]SEN98526.1 Ankyrin repeat-containing protein [Mesobacillus persicus]
MRHSDSGKKFFEAIQIDDRKTVKKLLEYDQTIVNTENEEGLTPLGYASHFGHLKTVKLLLDNGADVNAISHSKISFIPSNTALHAAIAGERNLEVIKTLLEHKGQTNIFDSNGHTCLHSAAYHLDNVQLISLLIENGAPVNAKVDGGKTALEIALEREHQQIAELLGEFRVND